MSRYRSDPLFHLRLSAIIPQHRLDRRVLRQCITSKLASDSALLVSTERSLIVQRTVLIDPDLYERPRVIINGYSGREIHQGIRTVPAWRAFETRIIWLASS